MKPEARRGLPAYKSIRPPSKACSGQYLLLAFSRSRVTPALSGPGAARSPNRVGAPHSGVGMALTSGRRSIADCLAGRLPGSDVTSVRCCWRTMNEAARAAKRAARAFAHRLREGFRVRLGEGALELDGWPADQAWMQAWMQASMRRLTNASAALLMGGPFGVWQEWRPAGLSARCWRPWVVS